MNQGGALPTQNAVTGESLDRLAAALAGRKIELIVVDTADQARERVLALLAKGAEAHSGKSKTPQDVGLASLVAGSDR